MKAYSEKFKDPRWQKTRLEVLNRDQWRCRACGKGDKTLNVHHLFYSPDLIDTPWECPNTHLMTLCDECHQDAHDQPIYIPGTICLLLELGMLSLEAIEDIWYRWMDESGRTLHAAWGPLV